MPVTPGDRGTGHPWAPAGGCETPPYGWKIGPTPRPTAGTTADSLSANAQITILHSHCPLADASAARTNDTPRMSDETRVGTIGIIGAGRIGQAFARLAQRAGREVVIANSRGPESLAPVVAALGAGVSAGTTAEAAASAMVVIAVPWTSVPAAVAGLVWNGEIVIDATNAFSSPT